MDKFFRMSTVCVALALCSQGVFAAQDADDFVEDASAKGIAEVEAGKLAEEKSKSAQVREFAQMMVQDHTAANEKLKTIAQNKNLEVSDDAQLMDKAKAMILDLRNASSFDQAYANNQVKAHEATIELFEEQASSGEDAELKAFATEMLPKLKEHLVHAKELAAATGGDTAKN
jgi:putative membrane protein